MSDSSSDSEPYDSGATGKGWELPSSLGLRLTQDTQSGSELSRGGAKDGRDEEEFVTSGSGEGSSTVMVAQPPRGSGKEAGLQEIALTGSEALDALDQVYKFTKIMTILLCSEILQTCCK